MLPQIDNQMNNDTQTIELPSKTYKLNLNVDETVTKINGYAEKECTTKNSFLPQSVNGPIHNIIMKGNIEQLGTPDISSKVPIIPVNGNITIVLKDNDNTESQSLSVNLGSIALFKINDYSDYIYYDEDTNKWYFYKIINKIILNGSENWSLISNDDNLNHFRFTLSSSIRAINNATTRNARSDYFRPMSTNNITDVSGIAITDTQVDLTIMTKTTVSDLKSWLSSHNTNAYYILRNPVITEITNTTLINNLNTIMNSHTYKDKTVIQITNASNSTYPIITWQYYKKDNIKFETSEVDKIAGFVDNVEAVRQAVYHILMTERYAYLIYDDNYGVELEQYIGKDIEYLRNTIQGTLREALTHDLRILNVEVNNINQISDDVAEIYFTVESIYGNLQMEVNINV